MSDSTQPNIPPGAEDLGDRARNKQRAVDIEQLAQILPPLQLGNPEDTLLWNQNSSRNVLKRLRSGMYPKQDSNAYLPSKRFDELAYWARWLSGARSALLFSALIVLSVILWLLPIRFYEDLFDVGNAAPYSKILRTFVVGSAAQHASAAQVPEVSKAISVGARILGLSALFFAIAAGILSSASNAVETGCLFRLGEFFVSGPRRNPSLLRSVIRRGALRSLLRDLFDHLYPLGRPTAEHLRRIAEQIYAENNSKLPDFSEPPPAGNWLHWIRTVESRLLLKLLAAEPSITYLLDDELERRKWWLRLIPIFTAHRSANGSHPILPSTSDRVSSNTIALVLALILLPLVGGYLNSSIVSHSQADVNRILLERILRGETPVTPGAPARDGRDGKDGREGLPGQNGRDGVPGRDGIAGKEGPKGGDGKDGAPGRDEVCCQGEQDGKAKSGVNSPEPTENRSEEGGDDLVPFTPTEKTANVTIDFYKSTSPSKPITLTLQTSEKSSWPPDPVLLVAKKPDGTTSRVSVSAKKTYNAFLNADVWIEESSSKKWYQFGSGKNLLVVHIQPRPIEADVPGAKSP